jgi:hypothetical protein
MPQARRPGWRQLPDIHIVASWRQLRATSGGLPKGRTARDGLDQFPQCLVGPARERRQFRAAGLGR